MFFGGDHSTFFLLFIFVWSCSVVVVGQNEIFSSTTELEKLFKRETEVVEKLVEYAVALEKDLDVIKKYIDDFNIIKKEGQVDKTASDFIANPLNSFHILKRTTIDLEDVLNSIKNQTKTEGLAEEVLKKSEKLPTFDDFVGASMALIGLQDTYELNLTEVIHGNIGTGINTPAYELSARDCLFLGKAAFNKGLYDRAIGWLETALARSEEEDRTVKATASKDEILPFLKTTRRVHDEVLEKRGPIGETWQTFSKPLDPKLARKKKYQMIKSYKPELYKPITPTEELENFKSLCRDEQLRPYKELKLLTPKMDAVLRCRLRRRAGTISFLAPFKIEEQSLEPYIILIHDFMNDGEMKVYRDIASYRLKRSLHQGKNGIYVATDIRTSKQAWLTIEDDPLVEKLTKRISVLTGLETLPENEASEGFQVANYGMAGRYTPHTDYITGKDHLMDPVERKRGNRIATLMVYLEDVQAGGFTVFPLIGVKVKAKKGVAVFWWNLRRDGSGDPLTRHGGCSVLYGEKWITNKWIRYNAQFDKVPCIVQGNEFIQEI